VTGSSGDSAGDRLGSNYWKLWLAGAVSNFGDGLSVIAYPWLAMAGRLPWLVFTLPAGVLTDRFDRRRIVLAMDVVRLILTAVIAATVFANEGSLNDPADIAEGLASVPANGTAAVAILYLAAFMLGAAEVLRDNTAQTLMPSIVPRQQLENANGKLYGAEIVMNHFVGPPAAGLLLAISFSLPLIIDAGSFAVAAALMFLVAGDFMPKGEVSSGKTTFRADISEGFGWLWRHKMLRSMAISLGALNGLVALTVATYVLFVQEVHRHSDWRRGRQLYRCSGQCPTGGWPVVVPHHHRHLGRLGSGRAISFRASSLRNVCAHGLRGGALERDHGGAAPKGCWVGSTAFTASSGGA